LFGTSQAATCWECEAPTDAPVTVTLRMLAQQLGTLTLCPACYHTCYLPLARDGSGGIDVSPGQAHVASRRPRWEPRTPCRHPGTPST
jgi:hypothetical protein